MLDPVEVVFFGCFVFLFLVQAEGFSGFGLWQRADVGGSPTGMFFDARSTSLGWVFVGRSLSSMVPGLLRSWLSLDGLYGSFLRSAPGSFLPGLAREGHNLYIRSRLVSFWSSWRSSDAGLIPGVGT